MTASTTPDFTTVTETPGVRATQSEMAQIYTRYLWASEFVNGKDVLEVACGSGPGLGYLKNKGANQIVGTDIEEGNLSYARDYYKNREGIILEIADASKMTYDSAKFDVLINFEAIYYLPDLAVALREANRVLKPGGKILISTVNSEWHGFNPSPFSHLYPTSEALAKMLEDAGFESDINLGFVDQPAGIARRIVATIRTLAIKLKLIPDTMKGKELLKRLFYGELTPVPNELVDNQYDSEELVHLSKQTEGTANYMFIYASGTKRPE